MSAGAFRDDQDRYADAEAYFCTIYLSAVKRMLPGVQVAVDLFHVMQLAVKTMSDVRRRAIRGIYGRRARSGDPGYGIKHLLERNVESLSPEQFAKENSAQC